MPALFIYYYTWTDKKDKTTNFNQIGILNHFQGRCCHYLILIEYPKSDNVLFRLNLTKDSTKETLRKRFLVSSGMNDRNKFNIKQLIKKNTINLWKGNENLLILFIVPQGGAEWPQWHPYNSRTISIDNTRQKAISSVHQKTGPSGSGIYAIYRCIHRVESGECNLCLQKLVKAAKQVILITPQATIQFNSFYLVNCTIQILHYIENYTSLWADESDISWKHNSRFRFSSENELYLKSLKSGPTAS